MKKSMESEHHQAVIPAMELASLISRVFERCGVTSASANLVADTLVEANLRGHPSHGAIRAPKWADGVSAGAINARCVPSVVKETPGVTLLDGDRGLGPVVADHAMRLAAHKARRNGIGMVSIRRASHIAMLQYYTYKLAEDGLIGIVLTNTESGVAPFGGIDKVLGTNPLSIGVPGMPAPIVLDMSTSQVARGKIVVAQSRGERIPMHWAVDADGRPTTDPVAALAGALLPAGGAKGSGLSIMVDLLSGALAGAAVGKRVRGTFDMKQEATKGDLFIAIDIAAACGLEAFLQRVEDIKADIRASRMAPGFDRIMLPGEFELECKSRHLRDGVPIEADLLAALRTRANGVEAGRAQV